LGVRFCDVLFALAVILPTRNFRPALYPSEKYAICTAAPVERHLLIPYN
jgi:hypothetical protein